MCNRFDVTDRPTDGRICHHNIALCMYRYADARQKKTSRAVTRSRVSDDIVNFLTGFGTRSSESHTTETQPRLLRPYNYPPTEEFHPLSRHKKLCGRPAQYAPARCKFTSDLLTFKVVSESRVTWATCVPILVFPVLDLGPMYATDRRQTRIIA